MRPWLSSSLLVIAACAARVPDKQPPEPASAPAAQAPDKAIPDIATSETTQQMFKRSGLKKLQHALLDKVDVPVKETGRLDKQTQKALRKFQQSEGLAATGLPDYESIRRLGIGPDDVFHHHPPAKRKGVD